MIDGDKFDMSSAREHRKTTLTRMVQMSGDFRVTTQHGIVFGHVGDYLAIDEQGIRYPVERAVFERSYERVEKRDG